MRRMFLLITVAMFCVSIGIAQERVTITTDPRLTARPVSAMIEQLRRGEDVPVTYEDPRYPRSSDMDERPAVFAFAREEMRGKDAAEATITRMLREYEGLGGPTFTVLKEGSRFHVVPIAILSASGQRIRQESVLDTLISVPPAKRNGAQILQEICNQIQKQTGYTIDVGVGVPANQLVRYSTKDGIENQTARIALSHLLDSSSTEGRYVWDLYYDANDKSYGLNFSHIGHSGRIEK